MARRKIQENLGLKIDMIELPKIEIKIDEKPEYFIYGMCGVAVLVLFYIIRLS